MQRCLLLTCLFIATSTTITRGDHVLHVGFAEADITPRIAADAPPVWLAGYGHGRRATGVHDPLFVRAVVLRDGEKRIALLSADVVGFMRGTTLRVREKLGEYDYVMLAATHSHEGPDTIGLWGRSPLVSGVDPKYLDLVIARCVEAVRAAEKHAAPVRAGYGTAKDESLLGDSRLPKVYDGVLRVLRLTRTRDNQTHGLLVQWNCHPEAMGSRNTQVTADFPWATVAALQKKHQCPVAYFTGPVGGLMAPPDDVVKDDDGNTLHEGDFEYTRRYGLMVAGLADKAIAAAKPITLTPLRVSTKTVALPLTNPFYLAGWRAGIVDRDAFIWQGNANKPGIGRAGRAVARNESLDAATEFAIKTEVGYLRLGELHVAAIPGEIYPELIYGNIQDPADPNADFPDAPKEKHLTAILPGDKALFFGLGNDEVGYIIPKRQWDAAAPYAYGRSRGQYGEINSVGPHVAPILMQALSEAVKDVKE